jgi:aminopeptidase N
MHASRLRCCYLVCALVVGAPGRTGALPAPQHPAAPTRPAPPVSEPVRGEPTPSRQWGPAPPGEPHAERARTFDVRHQVIRLRFDRQRRAVVGSTELRVAALGTPTSTVALDAVGMTIRRVATADGTPLAHRYDGRTLTVTLRAPLGRDPTTLAVDYEAVRPRSGVYFVDARHTVWAQAKLEDARFWVPTYDSPNDKLTWDLYITAPSGEQAFGAGRLAGRRTVDGGTEWHWAQETPAPTYFLAAAVGPFATVERSSGAVALRFWGPPDSAARLEHGFEAAPRAVELFARRLGTPHPYPAHDQAAVPDFIFWDALESWRPMITTTVQDERLVLGDGRSGWPGETAEMSVARAVAHEWFGKLVTRATGRTSGSPRASPTSWPRSTSRRPTARARPRRSSRGRV